VRDNVRVKKESRGRCMFDCEGFILVGGASSRMGVDKAYLTVGGSGFVERIAGALNSITERTSVVGAKVEAPAWSLPNVPDLHERWGAFGGLHAALAACRAEWAAVVACDLPFVTGELFVRLASLRDNVDAVVPVQTDGRPQPLCALYHARVCLERAGDLIASGERRPRALLQAVRTRWVAPGELADLNGAPNFFANINTPEEYARAKERMNDGIKDER
jgi:molybdopterin-guanine dinucleotide biosynthesis protein A